MKKPTAQLESKLFKGFADQSRLEILKLLLDKPKTVTEIVDAAELSQPNVSAHLACLLECGLVKKEKKGREVSYRISTKEVKKIIKGAQNILSRHGKEIYKCTRY